MYGDNAGVYLRNTETLTAQLLHHLDAALFQNSGLILKGLYMFIPCRPQSILHYIDIQCRCTHEHFSDGTDRLYDHHQ